MGLYLYAVVNRASGHRLPERGLGDSPVFWIPCGRVSGLASAVSYPWIRPERRHVAAHDAVLRSLLDVATPLPFAFGTIAENQETVECALLANHDDLVAGLERVQGAVELLLRLTFDGNLINVLVAEDPALRTARNQLFGEGRTPTRDQKIALGQRCERRLEAFRVDLASRLEPLLRPCCREVKFRRCRTEREVLNLACLVPRECEAAFQDLLPAAARLYDDRFSLRLSGPWPPSDFVALDLALEGGARVPD